MTTNSNDQIENLTKFESMSNELLMKLFEYYDFYSLFYLFSSLNYRIDKILYHCEVFVDFDQIKPIDFVDFLAQTLPKINPKNIRSLNASKLYQIATLANDKSLIYFTFIRSLSLTNIQPSILEYLVSRIDLSRLERIIINKCENEYTNTWSFFKHFLNPNRYHFLRTYKDSCSIIENVTSTLLIEHMTIYKTTSSHFLNFLNQSPYLKYVKTSIEFDDQYSEPIFLSPIPSYNALTHLHFDMYDQVCMRTIIYLFKCVPRICHLKLNAGIHYQSEYIDPIFWETLLSKCFGELKRLSLDVFSVDHGSSINPIWNYLSNKEKVNEQIKK